MDPAYEMVRVVPSLGLAGGVRELGLLRRWTDALMLLMLSFDERKKLVTRWCGMIIAGINC